VSVVQAGGGNGIYAMTLSGTSNTYTGATMVNFGTLNVTGNIANSAVTVDGTAGTAILSGGNGSSILVGNTGAITVQNGGKLAPGDATTPGATGILSPSNGANPALTIDNTSTLALKVNGTTAGTNFDQLRVVGTVALGSATLSLNGGIGVVAGTTLIGLISNDGNDAITGTFTGLAQGATLNNPFGNGENYRISYTGNINGSGVATAFSGGNDVVLEAGYTYTTYRTDGHADIGVASADYDSDGFSNQIEYLLGTDPTANTNGTGALTYSIQGSPGTQHNRLVFTRPGVNNPKFPSEATVVYKVQVSSDLVTWTDIVIPAANGNNVGTTANGAGTYSITVSNAGQPNETETVTVDDSTDSSGANQRFMRFGGTL